MFWRFVPQAQFKSSRKEAGIDAGLTRDLFVALGEPLGKEQNNNGAWSVRLYHKPFIRWIWLGSVFMALGGLIAILDKRYRRERRPVTKAAQVQSGAPASGELA